MTIWEILIIAVSVSIDAFAVSISGALCEGVGNIRRKAAMAAIFFGGFQFLMPLAGYFPARLLQGIISGCDHWIAFALLGFVGGKMIVEGLRMRPDEKSPQCPTGGSFFSPFRLVLPAIATSIDALATGAGIAFTGSGIWLPAAAMGVVTALISATGVCLGVRIGRLAGERPLMIIGGVAIVAIGVKILVGDLLES